MWRGHGPQQVRGQRVFPSSPVSRGRAVHACAPRVCTAAHTAYACVCVCAFREYYITMVKWATSTKVAVNWLNRAQNVSILTLCDATTGVCTKVRGWGWGGPQSREPRGRRAVLRLPAGLGPCGHSAVSRAAHGRRLRPRLCFGAPWWETLVQPQDVQLCASSRCRAGHGGVTPGHPCPPPLPSEPSPCCPVGAHRGLGAGPRPPVLGRSPHPRLARVGGSILHPTHSQTLPAVSGSSRPPHRRLGPGASRGQASTRDRPTAPRDVVIV